MAIAAPITDTQMRCSSSATACVAAFSFVLCCSFIYAALSMPTGFSSTIPRFDTIDSTNLEAIRQARVGAPEGLCVIAREQSVGRGRLDRTWHSPKDAGLYFSIV